MKLRHGNLSARGACVLLALLTGIPCMQATVPAFAQTDSAPADAAAKQRKIATEREAAFAAAEKVKTEGPAEVPLADQGMLALPKGFTYVSQPEANRLLQTNGNSGSQRTLGLIFPEGDDARWWAVLEFQPAGYVKDEEAKVWNADELLANLREGTEAANARRIERGFEPLEVSDWIEKPTYNASARHLVWSALVRHKGETGGNGSVNYNTYALGRDGYFSLDLVTGADMIAKDKVAAATLLANINYLPGKAYEDFNASTDHIAEYGIAALIGGVAAKKLGLLALGAAFVLKFAKIIGIAVIAFGAGIARFFRRKGPQA